MTDIKEKTKSSLYWQTVYQFIWEILRFGLSIIIARILDPKDFGIMGVASIIVVYTNTLTELGFNNTIIQRKELTESHINSIFALNLACSCILTCLTYVISPRIASYLAIPELTIALRVLSILFLITTFAQIPGALLRRNIDYKTYTKATLYKVFVQISTTLAIALIGLGYWALIMGFVFGELFFAVYLNLVVKHPYRLHFSLKAAREMCSFSIWTFIMSQITLIYDYSPKLIIGKILGTTWVGLYDKAYAISFMPVDSISMKINGVMFSTFSRIQSDYVSLREYMTKVLNISTLICFPIFAGLAVVAPYFVPLLFGQKWVGMILPMQILAFAFALRTIFGLLDGLNIASGDYKRHIQIRSILVISAVLITVNQVKNGIETISLIILISNFFMLISSALLSVSILRANFLAVLAPITPAFVNSAIMYITVRLSANYLLPDVTFVNLFLLVVCGAFVYFALFWVLPFNSTKDFKSHLYSMAGHFSKKIRFAIAS